MIFLAGFICGMLIVYTIMKIKYKIDEEMQIYHELRKEDGEWQK